jgi:uncharacterized protein YkwD
MRLLRSLLVLPVAAVAFAAAPVAGAAAATCAPGADWPAARSADAAEVVSLVNAHRRGMGLGDLAASPTLTAGAEWKARHMAQYRYMTHEDPAPPVAQGVGDRLAACGFPPSAGWGENIAAGQRSPQEVMTSWLNSPPHRASIEKASFRAIGVGVAVAANGTPYWSQEFGATADSGSAPAAPQPGSGPAPVTPPASVPGASPVTPAPAAPAQGTPAPAAPGAPGTPAPAQAQVGALPGPVAPGTAAADVAATPALMARLEGRRVQLALGRSATVRLRVTRLRGGGCTVRRCVTATWRLKAGTHVRSIPRVKDLRPGRYRVTLAARPHEDAPRAVVRLRLTIPR